MTSLVPNTEAEGCGSDQERQPQRGAVVKSVAPGSIASELCLRPGDRIVKVNGHAIRDVLEYSYLTEDRMVEIEVVRDTGERLVCEIEKDEDEDIGMVFMSSLFDGMMKCTNNCLFCFVRQNPNGVRESLRVKDDDPRLSFLHGNYISMTNLSDVHFDMLLKMRLSPLYVSVHSTDVRVRSRLMGYDREIDIMRQLSRLADAGITVHCQIVLCPQINDRFGLLRTVTDLARLHPQISSVAVVPVGLTVHRERLPALRRPDRTDALVTLEIVQRMQERFLRVLGTRFVFASDELFFLADSAIPETAEYEEYQQIENGVGLTRIMADEFSQILRERGLPKLGDARQLNFLTGVIGARALEIVLAALPQQARQRVRVLPVRNSFYGDPVTVTGLLSGKDIAEALTDLGRAHMAHHVGRPVAAISDIMVNSDEMFVDDLSLSSVRRTAVEQGVNLRVVPNGADGLYAALMELAK